MPKKIVDPNRQQYNIWFVGEDQIKQKRALELETFQTGIPMAENIREAIAIRAYLKDFFGDETVIPLLDLVKKHFEK
jgi:hypothetical protein